MWLKLDLDGITLSMQIEGYIKTVQGADPYSHWCKTDFSFTSGDWLNYNQESGEVFLPYEIEGIAKLLDDLLNDRLDREEEFECIEPDFCFILNPKKDLRNDPSVTYVKPGMEIVDIDVEWKISFWHEGLTANYLSVTLGRTDVESLLAYLYLVMGKLKETDSKIQALLAEGIIY